jgi:aminoglycoside phosphotransferase (APT) family kinase protein
VAPPRFAHGDLAPVNLLVQDGRVAAVLDLDGARLAHPLFDAAWLAWIISFHHGDVAEAAWGAYARAVGAGVRSPAALAWLWPLQLLERLAEARGEDERATWADRLVAVPRSSERPAQPESRP